MCYNFFVGQVYHGLCVHDVVNLLHLSKAMKNLYENKALKEALSKNAYESSFSYSKEKSCKECIQNP